MLLVEQKWNDFQIERERGMFCKKCGSEINDGAAFCPKCGATLKTANQTVPEQKNQPIPPIMSMPGINAGNTAQGTSGGSGSKMDGTAKAVTDALGNVAEKGKAFLGKIGGSGSDGQNGSTKKVLLIACIAAAAVLVLLVANGARINNFLHRTFSSPEKYYQFVEKKTVEELAEHAGYWYDSYVLDSLNFYNKSVEGELALELGEDGQEFVGLLGLAGVDVSWLESMVIGVDTAVKDDTVAVGSFLSLNGSDILSGNLKMDMKKGVAYFQIPELNKTYLGIDMAEEGYGSYDSDLLAEFQEVNRKMLRAYPDQAKVEKLLKRYMLLALECVDDVSKSKEVLKVEGIEQKCTVLKVTLDADTLQDMAEAVLTEMRDDKEIKAIMKSVLEASSEAVDENVDFDDAYEEFQDMIDDMLDELEYLSYLESDVVMKVYVDGKGEIKGRSIDLGYASVRSLMPEKGNKFGYEFSGEVYGMTVKLTGSGKTSGDKISGDFQVKYNGASLIEIVTKKLDIEELKDGRMNGRIEVKAASKIGSIIGSVPGLSIIEEMQINMDFESSKNASSCKIGFVYEDQDIGSLAVSIKTGNGSKATIPSGNNTIMMEDEDDLERWLEGVKLNNLINSLKKADIPSKITDSLDGVEDLEDLYDALYLLDRMYY